MSKQNDKDQEKSSRRRFLKKTFFTWFSASIPVMEGVKVIALAINPSPKTKTRGFALFKKYFNTIDEQYEIDPNYKRMDQKLTVFGRVAWDSPIGLLKGQFISSIAKIQNSIPNPLESITGFSETEHAIKSAAGAGHLLSMPLSVARTYGVLNN